jgi:hypothetical protein
MYSCFVDANAELAVGGVSLVAVVLSALGQ